MQIYNTQSRKKEEFVPIEPGKVTIYACGPTVYNYIHIGNARPAVVFDTLRRYFEHKGYKVTFVQNFTDIDDKMIRKANEEGVTVKEIADRYIKEYFVDAKALGIRPATVHPRATEHMPQIIAMIQKLVDKGFVQVTTDEKDRRIRRLQVTEEGLPALEAMRALKREWRAAVMQGFTEEEQRTLSQLLERLVENTQAHLAALAQEEKHE